GVKVRVPPAMGKILEEFGAQTTDYIPGPEVGAALKSGQIDLVVLSIPSFVAYKIHDNSSHMTIGISLGGGPCFFAVSQKAFDALPAKERETMLALREPALVQYGVLYAAEESNHFSAFRQKNIEITTFSTVDRARLLAKAV